MRRQRRRERAPRPGAEVGGRAAAGPRLALAVAAEDHRELARADHEQDRQRGDVEPAADVAVEQRRDDPAGERPADDREAELEAADARVEDRAGMRREVRRMEQDVAEPAADDRARHDAEDDEQEVVGAEAHRPGADRGERDAEEDRGRDRRASPSGRRRHRDGDTGRSRRR